MFIALAEAAAARSFALYFFISRRMACRMPSHVRSFVSSSANLLEHKSPKLRNDALCNTIAENLIVDISRQIAVWMTDLNCAGHSRSSSGLATDARYLTSGTKSSGSRRFTFLSKLLSLTDVRELCQRWCAFGAWAKLLVKLLAKLRF